ncbi:putative 5-formyltetrahydrofolate cyclo-ligase [Novosphingobium nitrogenifigens DSM 19370]|uniref:5-formyltetrahydrofolate cyclo-ligase n=1 Tax=Novosphingobium nitrogenifigens DSM 19370 TaxID=983920 RepID=F1Z9T1_9SPHN|nr:5-formyltetrahydrofolate cyclo-ligase [Novosphingobium nitrogenifigens]EGD58661.1 putative 5-formyltetrahydrofolate cyclo-ligase [Novosphingobium nitrogenifigens DSM 19370]
MNDEDTAAVDKAALRKALRATRKAHVESLDPRIRALLLLRPPTALVDLIPKGATIGLYIPGRYEAPAVGYARFFHDAGHKIAMPWFAGRDTPMEFRHWTLPHLDELLVPGPYGVPQPEADVEALEPDFLFVPLVGFTANGARLGQGGGHYDRWLGAHHDVPAVGLAWDCQLVEELPHEDHDRPLVAVVTPTRLFGPFGESGDA